LRGYKEGRENVTTTIEEIVKAVEQLPQDQLRQFRAWLQEFDSEVWDEQIERDIKAGKLDGLAQAAIADHHVVKSQNVPLRFGNRR